MHARPCALAVCLLLAAVVRAEDASEALDPAAAAAREMAQAARVLLSSLTPEQRAKVSTPFADAQRRTWDFVPKQRPGLTLGELTPEQKQLALSFLAAGLSRDGFRTALVVMSLDAVLVRMRSNPSTRDPERFHLQVYGDPAADAIWGWRFEGHHLSLNLTVVGGRSVACTPTFVGANPNIVPAGDPRAGEQVLTVEEAVGRRLLAALGDEQRAAARIQEKVPADLVVGMPAAKPADPAGVPAAKLDERQRELLMLVVAAYADRWRSEFARQTVERVRAAGVERLHLAYAGSHEAGKALYYRITGPNLLIEFDHQHGNLGHVHTVWREPGNDFGDALAEHYRTQHAGEAPPPRP